jgi:Domain of unknown function (DUF4304)
MVAALKSQVIPALRAKGFSGTFPNLRRIALPRVDYLTFQFNSAGGSFVAELASSDSEGKPDGYGRELPIQKLNTHYFRERFRLGSDKKNGSGDHWFQFGPRMYDEAVQLREHAFYVGIADSVLAEFEGGGESWLSSRAKST